MSSNLVPSVFSSDQRSFLFSLLAQDKDYSEIIDLFRIKYRSYCASYPSDVLDKTLYDRLRTYRSKNALEISAYKSAVDVSDPAYLLCYLRDLLFRTPDVEIAGEGVDGLGNPYVRRKSNRGEICRFIIPHG